MADSLSQRLIGRLAALLFLVSGLVTLATVALPGSEEWNRTALGATALAGMAVGAVAWFLPWHRWPRQATYVFLPLAFALIAVGDLVKGDEWTYAIYYVVAFVWLGVAHPPRTALKVLPLMAAFYVAPLLIEPRGRDAVVSLFVVAPVCVLVAESLAWVSSRLRHAERLDLRRMHDMETLLDATVTLAEETDPVGAANLVADLAARLLRGSSAVVLLGDGSGTLRGTGGAHWQGRVRSLEITWLDDAAREAIQTGEVRTHGGGVVGRLTQASGGAPAMFLPLQASAGPLGLVMVTYASPTAIPTDGFTTGLARTFATQASLAFERLRATQVLVDASLRDPLTGVGNRRKADALLHQLRAGDVIALIDCDHFKAVNDRYGHAAGDRVLVDLATHLDRSLRDGDEVARWGGEEFIVVLRHAAAAGAAAVERLLAGWHDADPVTTFSAGVATHGEGEEPDATLARADAALYRAKSNGRDCVVDADATMRASA